jgi:4-hydroxy-tetrahydrodipicolinate synthase
MRPGSTVALVTPFFEDTGKVNFPALERILQFHVQEGTDNLCILGTTGEASTLSMEERRQVLTTTVEQVKGKMSILVGCGTIDPAKVKSMTQQAIDVGCDASLLVTPYYVKPPQRGLIKHALTAADVGLPIILYNVPGRTSVNFLDKSMAICAQHENIIGVKDATGDLSRLGSLKQALKDEKYDGEFLCYSGDDGSTADYCLAGGDGCISVTANCAPKVMHDIVMAARAGNEKEVRRLDDTVQALHKNLFCEANPIPVKWASYRMGLFNSPYCRPPLDVLDPSLEDLVENSLKEAGLIS